MKKTLIILAHPELKESRLNKQIIDVISNNQNVTINDLYLNYKSIHDIDVKKEQNLLITHDRIIFQFPLYWFSSPGLLKDWQDKVLEYGFAYGSEGSKLQGKEFKVVLTIGSPEYAYQAGGYVQASLTEILKPFETMAKFTRMIYTMPFTIHRALKISDKELQNRAMELQAIINEDDWTTSLSKYLESNI